MGLCAESGPITQGTTNLITVLLLPVAILMIAYALTTFYARSVYLQRKQVPAPTSPHLPCMHWLLAQFLAGNVWLVRVRFG